MTVFFLSLSSAGCWNCCHLRSAEGGQKWLLHKQWWWNSSASFQGSCFLSRGWGERAGLLFPCLDDSAPWGTGCCQATVAIYLQQHTQKWLTWLQVYSCLIFLWLPIWLKIRKVENTFLCTQHIQLLTCICLCVCSLWMYTLQLLSSVQDTLFICLFVCFTAFDLLPCAGYACYK